MPSFRYCFLLLLAAAPALHADDFPVPRGPAREPRPYRYDAKVLATAPKVFLEEAPAVTVYVGSSYILEADGTVEHITHEITRFNGRKGIDQYGEYRGISFDPTFEKLTLNEARVIKKDGRSIAVEPRHVQLRDVSTDFQVYDQQKQLVISYPALEVGDCYEVKWTVRGKNPEFDGQFFTRYTFGDDAVPVMLDEFHVLLPKGKTFHHKCINGTLEPAVHAAKDTKHYVWQAKECWPPPRDEDRPSKELMRLQVLCSTFKDWKAISDWKEKLREKCWECTEDVRAIVKEVTKGLKEPQDKARALTYWVRQNIRYLSRGPSGMGYTPHKPTQVLTNLFGDCKDQAQLLAVMLREIGLDPYLVTLGMVDDGQVIEDVPSPWGTHAILMVPIGKEEHWIDTTVNMAPWDWLPRSDRDRQTYLTRRGEIVLKRTPPYTSDDNRIEQTTFVAVQGDGSSICRRHMFFHGGVALGRRESWVEATPGERRRFLISEVTDAFPRSRLDGYDIAEKDLLQWDKPVGAQILFTIPKHFTGEKVKEASVTDSHVWGRILGFNLDMDRTLPLNLGSPFESLHYYVIHLPPAYRFDDIPQGKEVNSAWGTFRLMVKEDEANPRRLELVMHTKLKQVLVEPKDFAAFQGFHEELSKAYRVWLNIRPTNYIEDAPLLETLLAVAPGSDAFAARTLAKLYVDADRLDDARRVLDEACFHHGTDASLWEMRLKAARDGADREIIEESLVRYFPDEPRYALELGAARVQRRDFTGAHRILTPLTRHTLRGVRGKAFYELARLSFRQGQTGPALLNFEAARQMDRATVTSAAALTFLGQVHEKRGEREEAIAAYALGHQTDKDNTEILAHLVRLQTAAGKQTEALTHLRRLVLAVDGNLSGLVQAAEFYHQLGRFDEAFDVAQRARDLGYSGRVQRLLGLLHLQKHDYDKAAFHLERGELDAAALEALIKAHVYRGEPAAAFAQLDAVARLASVPPSLQEWEKELRSLAKQHKHLLLLRADPATPPSAELARAANVYLCADVAHRKGQPRGLVKSLLSKAFQDKIELAPALALRGLVHLEQGQVRKAAEDVDRAFLLAAADARAYYVRGRVRLEKAEAGAVDDLTRAAALTAEQDAAVLHWLASALQHACRIDDALVAQRKAVALRPSDAEMVEQLAALEKARP